MVVSPPRFAAPEVTADFIDEMKSLVTPPEDKGLLEACSEDICLFAQRMIGMELYAWQIFTLKQVQKAIDGDTLQRDFNALTSRQIGKSTLIQLISIWACVFNKRPVGMHNQTVVAITSASDKQAKKLVGKIRNMMYAGERYMHRQYEGQYTTSDGKFFQELLDPHKPNNTERISYKPYDEDDHGEYLLVGSDAGSFIESHPPTSGVLGETVSFLFIDEAGKTDKISDEFYYEEISPIGDRADAIRFKTSTPWTPSGFFFESCDPEGDFESEEQVFKFTIEALANEEHPEAQQQYDTVMKRIEQYRKAGKHDSIKRSYYCEFVKGDLNYFDPEKVRDMFIDEVQPVEEWDKPCDLGVDFGGQKTTCTTLEIATMDEETGVIRRLFNHKYKVGEENTTLIDDIEDLMSYFNIQRIIVDECPAAMSFIHIMEKEKGWNVIRMSYRRDKVRKYGAFRVKLYKGLIQSYPDSELRDEMTGLENSETSTQSRIRPGRNSTDDMIDAFVQACYFYVEDENKGVRFINLDDYD